MKTLVNQGFFHCLRIESYEKPEEPVAPNPPGGAIIDYTLGSGVTGPVKITILDAAGRVVRSFASTDVP